MELLKKFNPIKTMKKFIALILVLTIISSLAVCYLLSKRQSYSASILIEYTGAKAEKGLNPDDTVIDITEIYSATVIDNVIRNLNLNCGVEEIRSSVSVTPVIPLNETKRETAAVELNTEYSFIPTKFVVMYTADSDHSEEYAREVLDSILMQYYIFYSQKYVENVAHPNNSLNISLDVYDYLECVELLTNNINTIATFCMARDATFYSAKSGYSFVDIQLELEYLRDNLLYDLETYILENRLTVDKTLLLQKEANKATQYEIKIANTQTYIDEQKSIIDQFAVKTLDGQAGMGNLEDAGIITDVEDDFFRGQIDTTYDILINQYAQLLLEINYYQSELANTHKIIEHYSNVEEDFVVNPNAGILAKEQLDGILEQFNEIYDNFVLTVKDYYNVRSADYLSFNSNVETVANVNIKLYLIVAAFMFFVVWSCLFILCDRLKDILKYLNTEEKVIEENTQTQSE